MLKSIIKSSLIAFCAVGLTACGDMDMPGGADTGLDTGSNSSSSTDSSSSTGGSSTDTSTSTGSSTGNTASSANNVFSEFVKDGDTYFGPNGTQADLDSGLSGNDAAGSRFGGPNDVVGVLVVVRNSRGYMEVVNLENKNRFPVVFATTGENFSVPADTLGGKPFPSIFVGEIPSLLEVKFDHRISPNPEQCNRYTATYKDSDKKYHATKTGEGCRYINAGA